MKELLKSANKSELFLIGLYKVSVFVCWYLFACSFNIFLRDSIDDVKLVLLVLSLLGLYGLRVFLKSVYRNGVDAVFYNFKHSIEMYYFKKLNNVRLSDLEEIDKEELANRILEVAYNYSKIIFDMFEVIIPFFIGIFILFVKIFDLNKIFGVLIFVAFLWLLIYSYNNLDNDGAGFTNYNDLLKEFVRKIVSIKKINIFNYCVSKLDTTKENDMCILSNTDTVFSSKFNNLIFGFVSLILLSSFIFVRNTITRLGVIIFFIIIFLKLHDLIYKINPVIKNMFASSRNKTLLDTMLKESEQSQVNTSWKKIMIKNGVVNYETTTEDIKIPTFELIKNDHISIMGASGQGKSTVLNVLSGMFSLDEGDILFDGNSKNERVDAYYSDKIEIFSISLRDNIKFGNEVTDEFILELLEEVGLMEWYNSLSAGLDEILTDASVDNLIKQKINIVRAIISNKDVYFFDEPILESDTDAEKKIAGMLKKHFKDKTYIIISKKTVLTNLCKKHYFIKNHTLLEKEPLL